MVTLGRAGPELVAESFRDPDRVVQVDTRERGARVAGLGPVAGMLCMVALSVVVTATSFPVTQGELVRS